MGKAVAERIRETTAKYPSVDELKVAVLQDHYNSDCDYFSRGFLWKAVCLNSYRIVFKKDELRSIPEVGVPLTVDHSKHDLVRESAITNPLSDAYNDGDILDVIKLDVDRLIIDPLFENEERKKDIIEILYNYDKFNSYKQGYHELCGLVYLELYRDNPENNDIKIETFNVFTSLMLSVVPNFYVEDNLIGWCLSVFNKSLVLIDPGLYDFLVKRHKIESQVWLIRWVRLLFLRELGTSNTVRILDYLICYDFDLSKLIPFIIIILLIKIKIPLATCDDNGEVLNLLLHYPYTELSHLQIKELIDLSIKLYRVSDSQLGLLGQEVNEKLHPGYSWGKLQDLGRLRMEIRLQRRVNRVLRK